MTPETQPEELEPCPFCGGDAFVIEDRGDNACEPLLYRPQCKVCGGGLGGFDHKAEAEEAWNRRTPAKPERGPAEGTESRTPELDKLRDRCAAKAAAGMVDIKFTIDRRGNPSAEDLAREVNALDDAIEAGLAVQFSFNDNRRLAPLSPAPAAVRGQTAPFSQQDVALIDTALGFCTNARTTSAWSRIRDAALKLAGYTGSPVPALASPEPPTYAEWTGRDEPDPEWWPLRQFGYAPGNYITTCRACGDQPWGCDKRSSICRPCAEKRLAALAPPLHPGEPSAGLDREPSADETAWLIEETWSGYVHYIDQTFEAEAWRREADSIDELPLVWVPTGTGGATLTHRKPKFGFITKNDSEAMRFPTKEAAEAWIAAQPRWFNHGDQFQAREHMWPAPEGYPGEPSAGEASATPNREGGE